MSTQKNINDLLDDSFKNYNYLPQKLLLEDIDEGVRDYIKNLNLSLPDENDNLRLVPIIYLTQERWAEYKKNWEAMRDESGEEITMPFMALVRNSVKYGTNPKKRTIPKKLKFTYYKIPNFDGTVKGYNIIKIPQPVWVDTEYELSFVTHYIQNVNKFYETMFVDGFSDGQGYIKVNGYHIPIMMEDPTESNTVDDVAADRKFQIIASLKAHGKLVDPTKFKKVEAVSRIMINIKESL